MAMLAVRNFSKKKGKKKKIRVLGCSPDLISQLILADLIVLCELEQAETSLAKFKRTTSVNFTDIYHYSLFQHESGKAENLQQFTVIEKRKKEETYCTTQSGTEPLAPEGVAKKLKKQL